MAIDICWYFQVHQPWRLKNFRYLDVGKSHSYFDNQKNAAILRKIADKCYLPMNNILFELVTELKGEFKVAFSITTTALQQMEDYAPEVIGSFKRLFDTGYVELLSETSHHSLASLYSPDEFKKQVMIHREEMSRLLIPPVSVFRNTELISSNAIVKLVAEMGFKGMLMEGADHILRWRSPLFKYRFNSAPQMPILMKNYRLSDDIAFRFSDRNWSQWPLTSEKFTEWIKWIHLENPVAIRGGVPFTGLFMDYETFGEHQWASTGIFEFMKSLPARLLAEKGLRFVTPSEACAGKVEEGCLAEECLIDAPDPFSWADVERDLSAWQGNPIQDAALRAIYALENPIRAKAKELGDEKGAELLETWRRLTTSDHFYYMCTKYFSDGDVHKYFNPFESPYDAHIIYMNVLADLGLQSGFPSGVELGGATQAIA